MENRNILIGLGTGLVAGLLGGFGLGYWMGTNQGHSHPAAGPAPVQAPAGMPAGMPPAGMPPQGMGGAQVDAFARIAATKAALERDPKNFEAWVQLGNDYFDTHQPQLSVDAYGKAIALKPDHPQISDVLTDQGVMYREMKDFKKALDNFKKASAADPKHLPSLLNQGIVYANDMNDKAQAKKVWTRLVEMAPDSPQGVQAKELLKAL